MESQVTTVRCLSYAPQWPPASSRPITTRVCLGARDLLFADSPTVRNGKTQTRQMSWRHTDIVGILIKMHGILCKQHAMA